MLAGVFSGDFSQYFESVHVMRGKPLVCLAPKSKLLELISKKYSQYRIEYITLIYYFVFSDCPKCEQKYITKQGLRNHVKMVHEGIRKHICDYPECANKLFPAAIMLRQHIEKVHKGIKNEICDE